MKFAGNDFGLWRVWIAVPVRAGTTPGGPGLFPR